MYKVVVLISGNGSNLQAILNVISRNGWPIEIAAVVSDKANAYGLQRAQQANIATQVIDANNAQALQQAVDSYEPDLVVLAGFMRILPPEFVNYFQGRLINIHPSLLPKYKGLHTHKRALEAGDSEHGVSIHYVTEELDGGPIIAQISFEMSPEDTEENLVTQVHALEHQLYPIIIHWLSQSRIHLTEDGVQFDQAPVGKQGLTFTADDLK